MVLTQIPLLACRVHFGERTKEEREKLRGNAARSLTASAARVRFLDIVRNEDDLRHLSRGDIERACGRAVREWDVDKLLRQAEQDAFMARARGFFWVSILESDYPPTLREIFDPPAVLFVLGSLPRPDKPLAGMVGTRKPSAEGIAWAFENARLLGRAGVGVVSGLALGIDAMAGRGNAAGGAQGVAVLGSGVDYLAPSSSRPVAEKILGAGGCLMSELPPGTRPAKWNFPVRNRIIAGLCRAVIVVEAPMKSGALITAGLALEEGRDLYVGPFGAGCLSLARDGAKMLRSAGELLTDWG